VASLAYRRFVTYSVLGSVLWVGSLLYAGYLFGNIPWVKSNLSLIVVLIVIVSVLPAAVTFLKEHRGRAEK
jgi:membrane-associated protein